jgi:small subunit ribosomal protein S8
MTNYTISDFISKLNIARRNHLKTIIIKPSRIVFELLKVLENLGTIRGYHMLDEFAVEVVFKYDQGKTVFTNIKVVSTPGRRLYLSILELYKLKDRYPNEIFILSTSHGLKLDIDCFKEQLGGLVLLRISF